MEKINDYKLTNIEEALNIVTSTSKYWELPTIICDKENPNKFIEVTSSEKTSERGPYLATKFDVYNEGERQKCKEFSHGEFMRYHTYKGDNTSDAGEAHWKNIMIEMKSKGEFNNDVIIFKDVKDFDKYKENPNVDILKPVKKEKPVVFSIKQNDYETFLQNDKISLGDILEVYSKADVKFQELAKQGSNIDEVTFASLTQNENKVSSISIDMDNNKLSILDGNYENDKTKNYFLDKAVDILNKVGKEKIKNHLYKAEVNYVEVKESNQKEKYAEFKEPIIINDNKIEKKLLPIINSKVHIHLSKIEELTERKSILEDKINSNYKQIDKFTSRAERLQDTINMLSSLPFTSKAFDLIIENNKNKIEKINKIKIPKKESKIAYRSAKVSKLNYRIDVKQCKIDKLMNFSKLITSFTILNNSERRETFKDALDGMKEASERHINLKLEKCNKTIESVQHKYNQTENAVEKLDLSSKLNNLQDKQKVLNEKLNKIKSYKSLKEKPNQIVDKVMVSVASECEKDLSKPIDKLNISNLVEKIVLKNNDNIENEKSTKPVKKESFSFSNKKRKEMSVELASAPKKELKQHSIGKGVELS